MSERIKEKFQMGDKADIAGAMLALMVRKNGGKYVTTAGAIESELDYSEGLDIQYDEETDMVTVSLKGEMVL